MLGVRRKDEGHGHARRLLDAPHEMSRRDPTSSGVTLNTEAPHNVPIYQHFGYDVISHVRLGRDRETLGLLSSR